MTVVIPNPVAAVYDRRPLPVSAQSQPFPQLSSVSQCLSGFNPENLFCVFCAFSRQIHFLLNAYSRNLGLGIKPSPALPVVFAGSIMTPFFSHMMLDRPDLKDYTPFHEM